MTLGGYLLPNGENREAPPLPPGQNERPQLLIKTAEMVIKRRTVVPVNVDGGTVSRWANLAADDR